MTSDFATRRSLWNVHIASTDERTAIGDGGKVVVNDFYFFSVLIEKLVVKSCIESFFAFGLERRLRSLMMGEKKKTERSLL